MFVFGTADDAFAMAVRIEENGNAFYAGAAEIAKNPEVKKLFEDLALMEASHIKIFRTLRSQLPDTASEVVWDPEGLAESYLEAERGFPRVYSSSSDREIEDGQNSRGSS